MPTVRLFVYGTLMPGGPLWPELAPYAVSWEPVTAEGRLWDTGLGYPAVRFEPGGGTVRGVLVSIDPERASDAVELLDRIEDEGRLYRADPAVDSDDHRPARPADVEARGGAQ